MLRTKRARIEDELYSTREGNSIPIYAIICNDFVANLVFSFFAVSDLLNCRQVAKRWRAITNNDDMWFQKYIRSAEINEQNIKTIGPKPNGHFRRVFLHRFARNDLLFILASNFDNTGNEKFLLQFRQIAQGTDLSIHSIKNCKGGLKEHNIWIDKVVSQKYKDGHFSVPTEHNAITCICTLYSLSTPKSVKLCVDIENASSVEVSIIALYEEEDEPECLCKFSQPRRNNWLYQTRPHISIFMVKDACHKLANFLGVTITPKELMVFLREIFSTASKRAAEQITEFTKPHITSFSLFQHLQNIITKENRDNQKRVDSNGFFVEYYYDLYYRASGELRKREALSEAKALKANSVINLLEQSVFCGFDFWCGSGRQYSLNTTSDISPILSCAIKCELVLTIPPHSPMKIFLYLECNLPNNTTSNVYVAANYQPILVKTIRYGRDTYNTYDTYLLLDNLNSICENLGLPSLSITPVDFLSYLLIASNIHYDFLVQGNNKPKLWNLKSLEGVELEFEATNKTRVPLYLQQQEACVRLREEVNWYGPLQFSKIREQ